MEEFNVLGATIERINSIPRDQIENELVRPLAGRFASEVMRRVFPEIVERISKEIKAALPKFEGKDTLEFTVQFKGYDAGEFIDRINLVEVREVRVEKID